MTGDSGSWRIYRNDNERREDVSTWPLTAPPWRSFPAPGDASFFASDPPGSFPENFFYLAGSKVIDTVNIALHLRRPILVTGAPGTGKTSLAESIAYELGLGPVLPWLITSRSTLREGLYEYDVLARVNDMNLADRAVVLKDDVLPHAAKAAALADAASEIGRYITLGPLGDALLPRRRPRVLLVDEIDKSDIDLPGDLLHVFERGWFEIPELVRERNSLVSVRRFGGAPDVLVRNGRVQCYQFPVILLTSNEEREFPPAFRRRCLHIDLEPPTESDLVTIARHKLDAEPDGELISTFVAKRGADGRRLATDQLLSALYLRLSSEGYTDDDLSRFQEIVLASLSDASLGD